MNWAYQSKLAGTKSDQILAYLGSRAPWCLHLQISKQFDTISHRCDRKSEMCSDTIAHNTIGWKSFCPTCSSKNKQSLRRFGNLARATTYLSNQKYPTLWILLPSFSRRLRRHSVLPNRSWSYGEALGQQQNLSTKAEKNDPAEPIVSTLFIVFGVFRRVPKGVLSQTCKCHG